MSNILDFFQTTSVAGIINLLQS